MLSPQWSPHLDVLTAQGELIIGVVRRYGQVTQIYLIAVAKQLTYKKLAWDANLAFAFSIAKPAVEPPP